MIQVSFDVVSSKIKEKTGMSDTEIEAKIQDKMKQLSGLISRDGAARIIANEYGITFDQEKQPIGLSKIKDLQEGMRSIQTQGSVKRVFDVRTFETNGRSGKVGSFFIADETGQIRVTAWGSKADHVSTLSENDVVEVQNAYIKMNNGFKEIHLNDKSELTINPKDVSIASQTNPRKPINELQEGDQNVELFGTIVQVFDLRFYEICNQCNRRAKPVEGGYQCSMHGSVTPLYSYVLNLVLDDGSGNLRIVFFSNQAQKLLKKTNEEILKFKDQSFEEIKTQLLGEQVKVIGRASKNMMFDRLEFVCNSVITDVDPEAEMKQLDDATTNSSSV